MFQHNVSHKKTLRMQILMYTCQYFLPKILTSQFGHGRPLTTPQWANTNIGRALYRLF